MWARSRAATDGRRSQHKARVQEEKKRTREEMEKDLQELYHIKRSAGFNSDFDSFRSEFCLSCSPCLATELLCCRPVELPGST